MTEDADEPLASRYRSTAQVASCVVFTDEAGCILLVKPTHSEVWHLPGGVVEAGQSRAAAAIRKVKEELGPDVDAGRLTGVDYRPPAAVVARCDSCSMAALTSAQIEHIAPCACASR